ncbi:hypothetical protein [Salmonirosea aquatica]|uniref:Uncharacterized protein n=1 Tax=Salmonirosea aquatica TaxID=2654236 RepID=A0A7C9FBV9_9BACT|nr:hypothetical protein [Cytophagaceae bacterium SJW1-29]
MKNLLLPHVPPRQKTARMLSLVLMAWAVVLTHVPARAADELVQPGSDLQPTVTLQILSGDLRPMSRI